MARLNAAWGRSVEVLFDVGANVGQFAREAREELPHAKIYSFEPHSRSFEKLSKSKTDSLMFQHCLALSDEIGEVTFYEYAFEGDGSHINSLVPNARFPDAIRIQKQSDQGSQLDPRPILREREYRSN